MPSRQAEADVVERAVVRQNLKARECRAHPDREAVVAAIGRKRACGEERHLAERQRDHDEVDALGAQAHDAGREREQRRHAERERERDQRFVDSMRRQNADRIGAEPDERRMAERHQRAVADQQIERERRDGEDHHARDEAQHIGFGLERGEQRHDGEHEKDRDRQRMAGEQAAPARGRQRRSDVRHVSGPWRGTAPPDGRRARRAISR